MLETVADYFRPLGPFESALDVCCGTGRRCGCCGPLCGRRFVGIDRSAGMLAMARRLTAESTGDAKLDFVRGDALAMPFGDAFDLAICFGALGHILPGDQDCFVEEIKQALRPGGKFVFVTSERPPLWSPQYWWRRGFNAVMHVRNRLIVPPFVMFYLIFLLPRARTCRKHTAFRWNCPT